MERLQALVVVPHVVLHGEDEDDGVEASRETALLQQKQLLIGAVARDAGIDDLDGTEVGERVAQPRRDDLVRRDLHALDERIAKE